MKRIVAHVITAAVSLWILGVNLTNTKSLPILLWSVPKVLTILIMATLLLVNLKRKPVQIEDSFLVFCIAMISTHSSVFVPFFNDVLPMYQVTPLGAWQGMGILLNGLSMPFYIWAAISLGRNFTVLPEARKLSTTGIYGISRHPIYLTYIFWCITQNMIYQTWTVLGFSVFQILMFFYRARREEKILTDTFSEYDGYREKVMWLGRRKTIKS